MPLAAGMGPVAGSLAMNTALHARIVEVVVI
jgi:hypothetical protein